MKKLLFLTFLICSCAYAKLVHRCGDPIRVAVVDTGLGYNYESAKAKLCLVGHRDFSQVQKYNTKLYKYVQDPVPLDFHGHGTNIVGVISKYAGDANYCFIIVKYWNPHSTSEESVLASEKSLNYLAKLKPDVVNYSGGGSQIDFKEYDAIEIILNYGGTFVAAAGNERNNLDDPNNAYYPALYDRRIIVVGSTDSNGQKLISSNWGSRVTRWELGQSVMGFGIILTGTSQATAIATGKIVRQMARKCVE